HKIQLKQRKQSIERIHFATDTLEEKVKAFEQMQIELEQQKARLSALEGELKAAIMADLSGLKAAA
ncbi:MAG: GTPase, partial [Burkholderiaceae bacterium]